MNETKPSEEPIELPKLEESVNEVRPDEVLRTQRSGGRLEVKSALRSGIPFPS